MKPSRLSEIRSFSAQRFYPRLVHGSRGVRAFLLCLEPGQALPLRADSEEMLCYIIEGRGRLTIGDRVFSVSEGDFASAGPGEPRGLEAEERTVALWIHVSGRCETDE
jgi:quercetin dioxygenase-like cupin family protein